MNSYTCVNMRVCDTHIGVSDTCVSIGVCDTCLSIGVCDTRLSIGVCDTCVSMSMPCCDISALYQR